MSWLSNSDFTDVIRNTPLVSIDLIVESADSGKYLLGWRTNRPAQAHWFVPGGRIRKGEPFQVAYDRLVREELGLSTMAFRDSTWLGAYEHFYDDCVFGDSASTHYVVLSYKLVVDDSSLKLPVAQHSKYSWFSQRKILADETVHHYTQDYFKAE